MKWDSVKKAQAYKEGNNSIRLCLEEKFCLLKMLEKSLNKRNELV